MKIMQIEGTNVAVLNLGEISVELGLGLQVRRDFIEDVLGIPHACTEKAAIYWRVDDLPRIRERFVSNLLKIDAGKDEHKRVVKIDYTNHKGERTVRSIFPHGIYFGTTTYHPEPQWLMKAFCALKNAERTFALSNVHAWMPDAVPETRPA